MKKTNPSGIRKFLFQKKEHYAIPEGGNSSVQLGKILFLIFIVIVPVVVIPVHAIEFGNETVAISGNDTQFSLENFKQNFVSYFEPSGKGWDFIFFIFGLTLFALFTYFFYRFLRRRDLIPHFHFLDDKSGSRSAKHKIAYIAVYAACYPVTIFVFFVILAEMVFLTSQEMLPMNITLYVSMAIIGVVRMISYFKEELAEVVAQSIPFSLIAVFLTSTIVADPNFLTTEKLTIAFFDMVKYLPAVISAIIVLSVLEGICKVAFIIKRKILPIKDKTSST